MFSHFDYFFVDQRDDSANPCFAKWVMKNVKNAWNGENCIVATMINVRNEPLDIFQEKN